MNTKHVPGGYTMGFAPCFLFLSIVILCAVLLLSGCTTAYSSPDSKRATPDQTVTAQSPTPVPLLSELEPIGTTSTTNTTNIVFPPETIVAGVDVGSLSRSEAETIIRSTLAPITRPLVVYAGTISITIPTESFGLHIPIDTMLDEAYQQMNLVQSNVLTTSIEVPLHIDMDETALRSELQTLLVKTRKSSALHLVSNSLVLSGKFATRNHAIAPAFAYTLGRIINIDEAVERIHRRLLIPDSPHTVRLKWQTDPYAELPKPGFNALQQQVERLAQQWDQGVVGFYLQDLETGEVVAYNEDIVFSGASVMKVAILLHAYVRLAGFSEQQQEWLNYMIIESNNIAANNVLAASVGGYSYDAAYYGALQMSVMLQKLGLFNSYLLGPYSISSQESYGYEYLYYAPNTDEGSPYPEPYDLEDTSTVLSQIPSEDDRMLTQADEFLHTTPREISQVFVLIDQCSKGSGLLFTHFAKTLTPQRCQEMLDLLAQNGDTERIPAGLPPDVRVEHKSGWIDDMQADVGIIRSPGGDFVMAVFLYKDVFYLEDTVARPVIASFARLAYTAYNPIRLASSNN